MEAPLAAPKLASPDTCAHVRRGTEPGGRGLHGAQPARAGRPAQRSHPAGAMPPTRYSGATSLRTTSCSLLSDCYPLPKPLSPSY